MGKIGDYKILQELTQKGRRDIKVYKTRLRSNNRKLYVVKTYPKETHTRYAQKEFELLNILRNVPGIVKPIKLFEWDTKICLVEDYIPGVTLDKYIKNRSIIDCKLCGKIIKRLVTIFDKMHYMGVSHRDIKPANIILHDATTLPVVIDFDKALTRDEYKGKRTNVVGTPYYMAPELGAYYKKKWMKRDYDWFKGDVWSFGVTAFLLLHGEIPHKGISSMFDFSDVLLFLTKCSKSVNPRHYISSASNCDMTTCTLINLSLECDFNRRPTFKKLLEYL